MTVLKVVIVSALFVVVAHVSGAVSEEIEAYCVSISVNDDLLCLTWLDGEAGLEVCIVDHETDMETCVFKPIDPPGADRYRTPVAAPMIEV